MLQKASKHSETNEILDIENWYLGKSAQACRGEGNIYEHIV